MMPLYGYLTRRTQRGRYVCGVCGYCGMPGPWVLSGPRADLREDRVAAFGAMPASEWVLASDLTRVVIVVCRDCQTGESADGGDHRPDRHQLGAGPGPRGPSGQTHESEGGRR